MELSQKQTEKLEKDNEELRRQRLQDHKDIQQLRSLNQELKESAKEEEDLTIYIQELADIKGKLVAALLKSKQSLGQDSEDVALETAEDKAASAILQRELEHLFVINKMANEVKIALQDHKEPKVNEEAIK